MVCEAVSFAHFKSQFEPPLQLTEHDPSHVTWQVDPLSQETLPLTPTVTEHVDWVQLTLPECPVVSWQLEPAVQSALQEPAQLPVHIAPVAQ